MRSARHTIDRPSSFGQLLTKRCNAPLSFSEILDKNPVYNIYWKMKEKYIGFCYSAVENMYLRWQ